MAKVTIYHNPRCSKSRQALKLLEDRGASVDIIEYLKDPPPASKLDALCKAMKLDPIQVMRTKEKRFKELGLSKGDTRSRREWLELMAENPILIERPIVVKGTRAVLGRPPENVLSLL